ncbi:MAG: ATP-binding cassette domain-containing protein [Caulobacteraceae bacterium]
MTGVRLHDLTLGYERHPAVHHLDGAFGRDRLTAVVGPNGSGKSTLLKGIAGALQPLEGRIELDGLKPADIAYLPQEPGLNRPVPPDHRGPGDPGPVGPARPVRPDHPRRPPAPGRGDRGRGPDRLRGPADRHRLRRPAAAGAVRARAGAGRAPDPAGRAVLGHRHAHHRRPDRAPGPLAARGAHGDHGAA